MIGYDYETIDNLYAEYLTVLHNSIACNFAVSQGNMDADVHARADFFERMPITEVVLNPDDQELNDGTLSYADFAVIQYVENGSGSAVYYSPYEFFGVDFTN